jgi:hypothetical protein
VHANGCDIRCRISAELESEHLQRGLGEGGGGVRVSVCGTILEGETGGKQRDGFGFNFDIYFVVGRGMGE